jgi:hypothetical protein
MHTVKFVPYNVVLLIGHPSGRHEQKEKSVQNTKPNNQIEKLHQNIITIVSETWSFLLTR